MKKYLRKALAAFTATTMTLSLGMTSFAATFSDVTEDGYNWAIDAIETMAEEGIIQGVGDGMFAPASEVTKIQSLCLISRILGFTDEINADILNVGWDKYCEEIDKYNLEYGEKEIAFLLAKGVLSVGELEEYIGEAHRNDGLKRYEVAILLTKALGAEKLVTADMAQKLTYADASDIPATAKKFVAYISDIGLMQGNENKFSPNDTVTRAQAALVLFNMKNMTNFSFKKGLVASIDHVTRNIQLRTEEGEAVSFKAATGVILRYNADPIVINDAEVGYNAIVTYKGDEVYSVDFTDALIDEVVYGSYSGSGSSTLKGTTITINKLDEHDTDIDTSKKETYKVSEDAIITYNDNACALSTLKSGYYVKLTINQGIVTVIEAKGKEEKISGRVNKIVTIPVFTLRVEDDEGTVNDYILSSIVTVKKNGAASDLKEILEGDRVNLTLNYGRITAITATSKEQKKSGIIKEVIISADPRITITTGGVDTTYAIKDDAKITIGDKEGTFYDFRVGAAVDVVIESDTVTSVKSTVVNDVFTIEGTVESVNSAFNAVNVKFMDPTTGTEVKGTIFIKKTASIVDFATGRDKKISDIKVGNKLTLIVSMNAGSYEAGNVTITG